MSKPAGERYTVAVDFDGVIHSYTSPWVAPDIIPDPPVEGAIAWLMEIAKEFHVVIHSTRCATMEGTKAVLHYLADHGFVGTISGSCEKPPALVYVDDRAWRFEGPGTFPTAQQIHRARPWNK